LIEGDGSDKERERGQGGADSDHAEPHEGWVHIWPHFGHVGEAEGLSGGEAVDGWQMVGEDDMLHSVEGAAADDEGRVRRRLLQVGKGGLKVPERL
jgi:hypothetical protein